MKLKIIASISIFLTLFSGALFLEHKERREFYVPEAEEDVVEIMSTENKNDQNKGTKRYKVFKAREYVRVEGL